MTVRNKVIYLAGGCFWGVEKFFGLLNGVEKTQVGYANGKTTNPTYEEVCTGATNFAETVELQYDPNKISLITLLEEYFSIIDPTVLNRQGADIGTQYRTGIYYLEEEDKDIIKNFINSKQNDYKRPIVVENKKLENFYPAEEYHQKYLEKNPNGYCHIKF